jgi:site-specific DNA-methyltransferase (adenine-specific)
MDDVLNTIRAGDCIEAMNALPEASVDLAFADPPFNIGYDYDVYDDAREHQDYIDWSGRWITAVSRVLKPNGTFWLAIGDEYAAELKLQSQQIGFHCRSWVIWYYTFGVNCSKKFTRSHAHLFQFVKDPEDFTFRDGDLDNRVPSARELVYNDRRANPNGRLPDDTWIIRPADVVAELVSDDYGTWAPGELDSTTDMNRTFTLRPQDVSNCFTPPEDTWYFPRVAGTFKERAGFHGCQMPEQLLGRIIRTCSNPGDVVLDPFSGSATTLAVAKKLGRRHMGFDLSDDYVEYGRRRLDTIKVGDRLDGSPEPLKSAPATAAGKNAEKKKRKTRAEQDLINKERRYEQIQLELTLHGITGAFHTTHDGFSADRVVADPDLNREFVSVCERLGLVGDARTWNMLLFRLRKAGKLSHIVAEQRTNLAWEECDPYMFASEIAWQSMLDAGIASSLDEILCDPVLAAQFDAKAAEFAPGYRPLEYRWAALKLRKEAKSARGRGQVLIPPSRIENPVLLADLRYDDIPAEPGIYILSETETRQLYVGETLNLQAQLKLNQQQSHAWSEVSGTIQIQTLPIDHSTAGRLAWQSCLISKTFNERPRLNYFELQSVS